MKIKIEDGKIFVKCGYNKDFIAEAKMIQGRWNSPYWVFPQENESYVRDLLLKIYGENGLPQATVTIDLDLDTYECETGDILLGQVVVASRSGRDYPVRLADNAMLISGSFDRSGGSAKYPIVTWEKGTAIRVKNVPEALYEQVKDQPGVTLVNESTDKKAQLTAEREKLLQRLAEIDAELAKI